MRGRCLLTLTISRSELMGCCREAGWIFGRSSMVAPGNNFHYSSFMEHKSATLALAALGHGTRLSIYRLLVEAGRDGKLAGEIAQALTLPGATLSFHLKELAGASLVTS